MKVLLVNTGPHAQGNTFTALNEVAKRLQENGVEAEIVQVGTKPVRSCIACGQCVRACPQHIRIVAALREVAKLFG